jgi:hypothetical protein
VQAPDHDYVHRSTSGLMSLGLDIFIDLDAGVIKGAYLAFWRRKRFAQVE